MSRPPHPRPFPSGSPDGDPFPDREPLERLRELGEATGQDILGRVVEAYRRDVPRQLEEMRQALAGHDFEALRRGAHSLGGAAAVLGARAVRASCDALQRAARAGDEGSCRARLRELDTAHGDALAALAPIHPGDRGT